MADVNTATDVGQIVTLLTLVVGIVAQHIREGRTREWLEKDRARQEKLQKEERERQDRERRHESEDRIRVAADLHRQIEIDNAALTERHAETRHSLAENTEISRKAFSEANNANEKIAALVNQFNRLMSATHPEAASKVKGEETK
jgi:hypothetical protein